MNFDEIVPRKGSECVKYDGLQEHFGRTDLQPLWVADMDFEVCKEISDAIEQRARHHIYGYPTACDDYWQSIIDWCRRRHSLTVERAELAFLPGIVRGIGYLVNYFTREDDVVLIQEPVYHPFSIVAKGSHRRVAVNRLTFVDGRYEIDFDSLERQLAEVRPKMMIFCNPHNPGGRAWEAPVVARVASLCRRYGVILVSDEIHGDFELFGHRYTPLFNTGDDAEECGISLGAPSKTFNIPGLVSSWCIIKNPALRDGFYAWMAACEFSEPTMFATVATRAAYTKGEPWLEELLPYIEGNINAVVDFCERNIPQIRAYKPEASFLVWLDCHALGLDSAGLDDLFINHARLALNNGAMFGSGGDGFMRLNVACPRGVLLDSLKRLADAIARR